MDIELNPIISAILEKAFSDRRVSSEAHEMLQFYAEKLATDGLTDIDEYAFDFAEAPKLNGQIIALWDGDDPEAGLSAYGSILEAMSARIVECNLEKITNNTVQMYWDQLSKTLNS